MRWTDAQGVSTEPTLVAHLYRRAGFGITSAAAESLAHQSWDDLVDGLLDDLHVPDRTGDAVPLPKLTTIPQSMTPGYQWDSWNEWVQLVTWWVQRMIVTDTPLREKLVLLLSDQFPTSYMTVSYASLMHTQNQLFRTLGAGSFERLTQAVAVDPAMLIWLNTDTSVKASPNQNFARELMERFTMGIGNYSETDVIEAARCFTGWSLDWTTGEFRFVAAEHDAGTKTVLGRTGKFGGHEVIKLAVDSAASHRWVVARVWSWLGYPTTPNASVVADLVPGYAKDLCIENLLAAVFRHPEFVSSKAVNALVKQPIEWVVGAMRMLGVDSSALPSGTLAWWLGELGQQPFAPPTVGGWGNNGYWLTTGTANAYYGIAYALAGLADLSEIDRYDGNPAAQVQAVTALLGGPNWSSHTIAALTSLAKDLQNDGGAWPAQEVVALAMVSPDYTTN